MSETDLSAYLSPTATIDSDHPAVIEFAQDAIAKAASDGGTDLERSVAIYYAVRDSFRYDPYKFVLTVEGMRASTVVASGHGWCVPKAICMAACCRAVGIPARLGFADVRNHLMTKRMRDHMKTDLFLWHGYTDVYLGGKWIKATPAFNIELCERFNLLPLEFDGLDDSIYHAFDAEGNRHMEYVNERGTYADLPMDAMAATFREVYGTGVESSEYADADFEKDEIYTGE